MKNPGSCSECDGKVSKKTFVFEPYTTSRQNTLQSPSLQFSAVVVMLQLTRVELLCLLNLLGNLCLNCTCETYSTVAEKLLYCCACGVQRNKR